MQLSKNFSKEELINSPTAKRLNIDNEPDENAAFYMFQLADTLQTIRDEYGKPIIVNSAYRCPALNKAVGGAVSSDHVYFCAADIRSVSNTKKDNKALFNLIVNMAGKGTIHLRQIIDEYNYSWIHISINNVHNKVKHNECLHIK